MEEEEIEDDEELELPCAKESHAKKCPSKPMQSFEEKPPSKPMQRREKPVVHADSSRSIASLASCASLATTVLETPDPLPKHKCPSEPCLDACCGHEGDVAGGTLILKQEPLDKEPDVVAQADSFDPEAALQELAKLEAKLFLSSYYVILLIQWP